jgi:type II secretory pathway pseudopilin PulG
MELVVVMALLALMGIALLPSVGAFRGDSRQRAAADQIRGELAAARSRAKEEGRPYRVSLSEDLTRVRRAPDDSNFETAVAAGAPGGSAVAVDYKLDRVTAEIVADPSTNAVPPTPMSGWVTLATVQPDGTCREFSALVAIKESDQAIYLRMRGLTGTMRTVASPASKPMNPGGQ